MPLVQQFAAMAHVEVAHLALHAARVEAAPTADASTACEQRVAPRRQTFRGERPRLEHLSLDHAHRVREVQPVWIETARPVRRRGRRCLLGAEQVRDQPLAVLHRGGRVVQRVVDDPHDPACTALAVGAVEEGAEVGAVAKHPPEYVSDDQESRYEITYRVNRVV